jgi:mRNA interferase HicA
MKVSEFRRWLQAQGCTFEEGTRHTFVWFGKQRSVLPRHSSNEIPTGTVHAIRKQLGLVEQKDKKEE